MQSDITIDESNSTTWNNLLGEVYLSNSVWNMTGNSLFSSLDFLQPLQQKSIS
jgi:hypothetical protein